MTQSPGDRLEEARTLRDSGRHSEAIAVCEEILDGNPAEPEALELLWRLCDATDPAQAVAWLQAAIEAEPRQGNFHYMLGCTFADLGYHDEAVAAYREAMRRDEKHAKAANNLGVLLESTGELESAKSMYEAALRRDPGLAQARYNLGNALRRSGDLEGAAAFMAGAIEEAPGQPDWSANLGEVHLVQHRLDQALECFRAGLAADAGHGPCGFGVANVLRRVGRADQAEDKLRELLQRNPDHPGLQSNLLLCLHYRRGNDPQAVYEEHARWGSRFGRPSGNHFDTDPDPDRPLTIGYVSADFYGHPVARFLAGPLEARDRERCRVVCYSGVGQPDAVTERLRTLVDGWRDIRNASDEAVLRQVREDAVDILVDLSGHTASNRLRLFAARPAPVQVTWLGYPATTGLSAVDYRITDALADPEGAERFHSEALQRLPGGFLCYRPDEDAPPVSPVPALAAGHPTFGSFNNIAKASPHVVGLWARVLAAVPGSRMILKAGALGSEVARGYVAEEFSRHGIEAARYDLLAPELSEREHLARYAAVDVALDTFPYHGTTTTCEALWMGVPVVSLAGGSHVSRVGASLLHFAGLPELVASSEDEYVKHAAALATDPGRLKELRHSLRERLGRSPLLDAKGFARSLEAAYREMWRKWCAGQA